MFESVAIQNVTYNPLPQQMPVVAQAPDGYRQRQTFAGEKYAGGLNYKTAIDLNYDALRKRSIRAYEESSQARAAINRLNDSVINTGLSLQSAPITALLSVSQEVVQEKSTQIENRYKLWSNDKGCDMSRNNTLGQMERICFNNQLVKGDYFAYLHLSLDPLLINPLQVKLISPERVCTPWGTPHIEAAKRRGNVIIDGIEIDQDGVENFYYVKTVKPGSHTPEYIQMPRVGPDTGRIVMIHGVRQRFGDEPRGVPILAHIAHELEKITDYSILELQAAVANAAVAMVITPSENAPASNPFPISSFVPAGMDAQGNSTAGDSDYVNNYTNIGENKLSNTGGLMVSSLNAGEKLESHDSKRPNVNFQAFVDGMTKYLSASLNIPIEILNMEFGQNYSASRAAFLLFWQSINVWRDDFVSDFSTPVYQAWLLGEVATGQIVLPGYDTVNQRAAWNNSNWIGVPAPSLDPLKEERAAEIKIKNGGMTREQDSQLRHKTSFDANVDKLAVENARLVEANKPFEDTNND